MKLVYGRYYELEKQQSMKEYEEMDSKWNSA